MLILTSGQCQKRLGGVVQTPWLSHETPVKAKFNRSNVLLLHKKIHTYDIVTNAH